MSQRQSRASRGPYRIKNPKTSYEDRLARRRESRPRCKCGCGQAVEWDTSRCRWYRYAVGHYRQDHLYKDRAWLFEQYVLLRRTFAEIAEECGVHRHTVARRARILGIPIRSISEARIGRKVGAKNAAWKGGVADWDYSAGWKVIARKVRDRDKWTCQRCGECRKRWGHALHVHHIDGNKLNNDPANLTSLCAQCHRAEHREEVVPI